MTLSLRSVRTKFILLVAGVALVVAGVSVVYNLRAGQGQLREQVVLRGIAGSPGVAIGTRNAVTP